MSPECTGAIVSATLLSAPSGSTELLAPFQAGQSLFFDAFFAGDSPICLCQNFPHMFEQFTDCERLSEQLVPLPEGRSSSSSSTTVLGIAQTFVSPSNVVVQAWTKTIVKSC
jgi:hypothetical protein